MPIEQHPIPQDVAGYRFRLIGEMTLIQFLWLAGGIVLGIVAYSLPLPFFFKWPLAGAFVSLGAGIAFVPVQGRPMDKWIIAFIKSIYSPTQFAWKEIKPDMVTVSKPLSTPHPTPTTQNPPAKEPQVPVQTSEIPPSVTVVAKPQPAPVVATPILKIPKQEPTVVAPPKPTPMAQVKTAVPATTEARLPIPFTPTSPNTLVGMTLTPEGKILDGVLIEIISNGLSVRATKSNQLGQFLFAKSLDNGIYQILADKPGFSFDTYSLELKGQIIKPLKIQAKTNNKQ